MIRAFLIASVTAVGLSGAPFAQAPATTAQQPQAAAPGHNQQMMQMHEQMMAQMTAMDQKLDSLVSQMNAAQGQAKLDAMAALVTAMVDQQKQMHQHMASMGGMMGGMMGGAGRPGMTMGTSGAMMPAMGETFDPVCRAKIANNTAPTATYQGRTYQFCSIADKEAFLKNPTKYMGR